MNKKIIILIAIAIIFLLPGADTAFAAEIDTLEELGKEIFFDENLSTPKGQSCASCHTPEAGFADPNSELPVSKGVLPQNRFGNRNSPTAAYAAYSPEFGTIEENGETLYVGGQFWDGRAKNIEEQAKGPFLNPLEMNNPNERVVIVKIANSEYAEDFERLTGVDLGDRSAENIELAYNEVASAIAAFERTDEVNQFSSKYDLYLAGEATLTEEEEWGLELFNSEQTMCSDCHPSAGEKPLFTDFTYDNVGIPKNMDNPFYDLPKKFNPDGDNFIDYGLGGVLGIESENGKMKVPTLRNIAVTAPYMHNGVFTDLRTVVDFYNTRDTPDADWDAPEVAQNVNEDELGDLGLEPNEVDAIVAFLETLTDGYEPEN